MARMQKSFYRFLLEIASIIYIIMMASFWILNDMRGLSISEAALLYSTGFMVMACWFLLRSKA